MIVEFKNVSVPPAAVHETGLASCSFSLDAGDLALVSLEDRDALTPLPDLAQGLAEPAEGEILYKGENWARLSADRSAAMRSTIGRVFAGSGWISNLDVDENIVLAQMHHTKRPEREIQDEAAALAAFFEMPEIPRMRPHLVARNELRRAQWVRAFLGRPSLILLEQPALDLPAKWLGKLILQTRAARERGAAVMWITSDAGEAGNGDLKPTLKFELRNDKMHESKT